MATYLYYAKTDITLQAACRAHHEDTPGPMNPGGRSEVPGLGCACEFTALF